MSTTLTFPQDFLWGAATASYQIEGAVDQDGRAPSIWDTFSATPGKVKNGDTGAVACDHYHRYPDDIQLMKRIGLQAYRFSIAWPRIIPQGTGAVNAAGLDFYDKLVDELLANGIQPWGTLFHWDLPQALEDAGGWPARATAEAFVPYVDAVTKRLGDRVKHWMTLNEPWVFTFLGYGVGEHAPGRTDFADYLRATHHALLAHGWAMPVIRANSPDAQVGIVFNPSWNDPATPSPEDVAAAKRMSGFRNDWFIDPVYRGTYPDFMVALYREMGMAEDTLPIQEGDMAIIQAPVDFMGINFYNRNVIAHDPDSQDAFQARTLHPDGEYTEMDWEVSPEGLYNVLTYMHQHYAPGAIYVTENGAAFHDTVEAGAVNDARRLAFYRSYLAACHRAIQEGVPLKGYFAWSLLDNFEWAEGYTKRFGITYVDYDTQERILKSSGEWYSTVIQDNGFSV
ncbi:MAG: GH1 family beta-glucosidase [Anaerolineae bacterium]